MRKCRAHAGILRIGICCWFEQERSAPGTTTAGHEDRKENVLHIHYNIRYSHAVWQGGVDSDHRQPDDYLYPRDDQINKFSQRDALAAMTNVIARV